MITIYSKTGDKNEKHAGITNASNISTVSYLTVQVFEHMHGHIFHIHPDATATFQTKQFMLLSSNAFLCLLSSTPKTIPIGLELDQKDVEQFIEMLLGDDDKDGDRDRVGVYEDEIWSPPSSLSKWLVRLSFERPEERDTRYALFPAPPALLTRWTAGATS